MRPSSLLALGAAMVLGGCAASVQLPDTPSLTLEVPFVAPQNDLCAATSLSSISLYWEKHASFTSRLDSGDLARLTLIPERGGTLQSELSAAARQNGLVVYPLPPSFEALVRELQSGHPVILLVNRGIGLYPLWHYSVITGYNPSPQAFLAHFGEHPDEEIGVRTLEKMWERSGRWGIVPLPPSMIAATATPRTALKAIWEMERTADRTAAINAYTAARIRWPDDNDLLFALAAARAEQGESEEAQALYRELLVRDPSHPYALNNLAWLLYSKGEKEAARTMLQHHLENAGNPSELIRNSYDEMK